MFILFGWGHQKVAQHGPTIRHNCSNCGNNSSWHLCTVTTFFELFFVPVIPYSKKYFLYCPICSNSIELSEDHFKIFNNFALLNNALKEESILEEDYNTLIQRLKVNSLDIFTNQTEGDFNEEVLIQSHIENDKLTLAKVLKIAIPVIGILFLLYFL